MLHKPIPLDVHAISLALGRLAAREGIRVAALLPVVAQGYAGAGAGDLFSLFFCEMPECAGLAPEGYRYCLSCVQAQAGDRCAVRDCPGEVAASSLCVRCCESWYNSPTSAAKILWPMDRLRLIAEGKISPQERPTPEETPAEDGALLASAAVEAAVATSQQGDLRGLAAPKAAVEARTKDPTRCEAEGCGNEAAPGSRYWMERRESPQEDPGDPGDETKAQEEIVPEVEATCCRCGLRLGDRPFDTRHCSGYCARQTSQIAQDRARLFGRCARCGKPAPPDGLGEGGYLTYCSDECAEKADRGTGR